MHLASTQIGQNYIEKAPNPYTLNIYIIYITHLRIKDVNGKKGNKSPKETWSTTSHCLDTWFVPNDEARHTLSRWAVRTRMYNILGSQD